MLIARSSPSYSCCTYFMRVDLCFHSRPNSAVLSFFSRNTILYQVLLFVTICLLVDLHFLRFTGTFITIILLSTHWYQINLDFIWHLSHFRCLSHVSVPYSVQICDSTHRHFLQTRNLFSQLIFITQTLQDRTQTMYYL